MAGKIRHIEDGIQKAIVHWLIIMENQKRLTWFAIPNGGWRSKIEAAIMKGLGVRAGVPDLCVIIRGLAYFLEVKAPGEGLSDAQKDMIPILSSHGATCFVVRSLDEAMKAITLYFNNQQATG